MASAPSHVIGFDDAPFRRDHRGDVLVVGAVYAGPRLEGVISGKVRRDGVNSTRTLIRMISQSRFGRHLKVILTQGVAFAGFNVLDAPKVHRTLGIPVVVVARKPPNFDAIKSALLANVRGGHRKWKLIEQLGAMEPVANVFVQRVGLSRERTEALIDSLAIHGNMPEPLRAAHIIAGGIAGSDSRQRV